MGQTHPRPSSRAQEIDTIEQALASIRSALDVLRRAGSEPRDPEQGGAALDDSLARVRAAAAAIASATERWPATKVASEEAPPPTAPGERRGTG